jgi:hypothetical protein
VGLVISNRNKGVMEMKEKARDLPATVWAKLHKGKLEDVKPR